MQLGQLCRQNCSDDGQNGDDGPGCCALTLRKYLTPIHPLRPWRTAHRIPVWNGRNPAVPVHRIAYDTLDSAYAELDTGLTASAADWCNFKTNGSAMRTGGQ